MERKLTTSILFINPNRYYIHRDIGRVKLLSIQSIIERKRERKKILETALDSIRQQLIRLGAIRIMLFGSLNEDTVDMYSDLDLFVIMPSNKTGKQWMDFIYEKIEREVASDIIVYNEQEFKDNLAGNSFVDEITNTGTIIYDKES